MAETSPRRLLASEIAPRLARKRGDMALYKTKAILVGGVAALALCIGGSAAQVFITQLVGRERLVEANSNQATATSIAGLIGPVVAGMLVVGGKLIPWLLVRIAHTRSRELFTLGVLAIALGIAWLAYYLFHSFALGAFLTIIWRLVPYSVGVCGFFLFVLLVAAMALVIVKKVQSPAAMLLALCGAGALLLLPAGQCLADDGGIPEAGGTLIGWVSSDGFIIAVAMGFPAAGAGVLGGAGGYYVGDQMDQVKYCPKCGVTYTQEAQYCAADGSPPTKRRIGPKGLLFIGLTTLV